MIEIVPAILPENMGELRAKASMVQHFVKTIQIDFCDGVFVSSTTWPYNGKDSLAYQKIISEEESLPFADTIDYEFDLMVKNASQKFEEIMKLGPTRVLFHIDAEDDLLGFFENLEPYLKEHIIFGLSLSRTADSEILEQYLPHISFVQCMGIERIGYQGQPFDETVIDQVRQLHERFPQLTISVDGGVNLQTGTKLAEAGATKLVVGSALFSKLDIAGTINEFTHIA